MREEVIKKVAVDSWNMGGDFRRSIIMFRVDHGSHMVDFEQLNEIAPSWSGFVDLLLSDKDLFAELHWFRFNNLRNNEIYIDYYEGRSSCRRATMYSYPSTHHKWAKGAKRAKMGELYISCNGKVELPHRIFFDDLLDLVHTIVSHRGQGEGFLMALDSKKPSKKEWFKYLKWDSHRPLKTTQSVCGMGENTDDCPDFDEDNEVVEF